MMSCFRRAGAIRMVARRGALVALAVLSGCAAYRVPVYTAGPAREEDERIEVRLDLRERGERRVIFGVMERSGARLTMVLYSPLGATLLVHQGDAPPGPGELAGHRYRPLLDLIYATCFLREAPAGVSWSVVSRTSVEMCAVIEPERAEVCMRQR